MTHPRQQIRDAAVQILADAAIVPEGSIYVNRTTRMSGRPRPAIGVFTASERLMEHNAAPRQHTRMLDMVVVVLVDGNDDDGLDDVIDTLTGRVEDALHVDHTVGGCANDINLTEVMITPSAEGDRVEMAAVMVFEVEYITEVDIRAVDDFLQVHNEWEARHAPPASETTEIPQE